MGKNYTFVRGAAFPYQYKYEHPAVTTDCVIFTYEDWKLKVLLVKRGGEPYKGEWALPGGFLCHFTFFNSHLNNILIFTLSK